MEKSNRKTPRRKGKKQKGEEPIPFAPELSADGKPEPLTLGTNEAIQRAIEEAIKSATDAESTQHAARCNWKLTNPVFNGASAIITHFRYNVAETRWETLYTLRTRNRDEARSFNVAEFQAGDLFKVIPLRGAPGVQKQDPAVFCILTDWVKGSEPGRLKVNWQTTKDETAARGAAKVIKTMMAAIAAGG